MAKSKVTEYHNQQINQFRSTLSMIPSENFVSKAVLAASGTLFTNKYSEGYPGARYYGGNEIIDQLERYTQELANELFGTVHANVQPYSGSPANLAVDLALAKPGEKIMGLKLTHGGHLTHGADVSATGKFFNAIQYGVDNQGQIDYEELRRLAQENLPKVIWSGTTAYPYILDWAKFAEIADEVGAYLVADISHISGLVIGGVHPSPTPFVDVITTTTHKTLRGPRGAMILVTQKGLDKDPELPKKIDKAVFPGLQGGPHNHTTAAMAVAFEEALTPEFKTYAEQVVKNSQVLAEELGTHSENHLILWDLSEYGFGLGAQAEYALQQAGIITNKNTVPGEKASAFYPSGIRLGTPALSSRGMKEEEMVTIAGWIKQVIDEVKGHDLPKEQSERSAFLKEYRQQVDQNDNIKKIKDEVAAFATQFALPGVDDVD